MKFFKRQNKNIPKKQHYVPKTYLKHFADDKGNIYVHDKTEQKTFSTGFGHVGFENYFYTDNKDATVVEKIFQKKIEDDYNKYVHILNQGDLNVECKKFFADFISVQFLRVPFYREMMGQLASNIAEKIQNNSICITKKKHVHTIFSNYRRYSELLLKEFHWVVCTSDEDSFMTSDNPCTIMNDVDRQIMGFGRPGCQIYFPVLKQLCLVLIQKSTGLQELQNSSSISRKSRRYYKKMFNKKGNVKIEDIMPNKMSFSKDQVLYANSHQAHLSLRYVFSSSNDFSIINKIREDDSGYGEKNRKLVITN